MKKGSIRLELLADVVDRRSAQIRLSGHLGGAFALTGSPQQQDNLRRRKVAPLEDRSAVEGVGLDTLLTAPDLERAGLGPAKAVSLPPAGPAARTLQPIGMEVLAKPDSASVVVDKINEWEVHFGLWFLNKAGTLHRSDSLLPCTVSGHEPRSRTSTTGERCSITAG